MARYLISGTYTAEGAKGLLARGGSARRAAVEEMLKGLGGSVESSTSRSATQASTSSPRCPTRPRRPPSP